MGTTGKSGLLPAQGLAVAATAHLVLRLWRSTNVHVSHKRGSCSDTFLVCAFRAGTQEERYSFFHPQQTEHLCPVIWALAGGPWPLFCVSWVFFPKVDPASELGSKVAAPETSGLDPAYSFSGAAIQSTANRVA